MAAVEYGTIGIRPMGAYNPGTKYDLLNLVEYDGSSYVAHTDPPLGSLPTDINYWQVSAQGTGKATADSVGTVKPDGKTTEVSADGKLSVKKATDTTLGLVKGTRSISVSEDGSIYIPTEFERAKELVDISSGEILHMMLGKISKAISVTMGLDQNALLKNMLTNMDADDSNKIPTSAYVHKLTERIGMGTELTGGGNLTAAVNEVNSNLDNLNNVSGGTIELSNGNAIYYRKRGNNIDIIISIVSQVTFTGSPYVFGQLPEGYRPPNTRYVNCYGSNALIQILPDGVIATYQSVTNSILMGQCSYSI